MVLALILGSMFENSLRQSLLISDGSFLVFFTRPIAAAGMTATFLMLISCIILVFRKRREAICPGVIFFWVPVSFGP